MRVLMYATGFGLGHLRRCYNIARELLAKEPGSTVLTVADFRSNHSFPPVPGLDYLRLPSFIKASRTTWKPELLSTTVEELVELRASILLETFRAFEPDAVLIDHRPVGIEGELKPLLLEASRRARRPRMYLGFRDILEEPDVMWARWHRYGASEFFDAYDGLLIYGQREIYDLESEMGLAGLVRNVVWTGYVAPPASAPAAVETTLRRPLILMMGGSGDDAFPVTHAFVEALPSILRAVDGQTVVLTGPSMPKALRDALRAGCRHGRVRIETSVEDATSLVGGAEALVMQCGYNSAVEALRWNKRALVVPRPGPVAEQRMRAQLFAQRSLLRTLDPDELSPERLADELLDLLQDDAVPDVGAMPPLDGAPRAASVLLRGVDGRCG